MNIPKSKVSAVLVDCKLNNRSCELLENQGIRVIKTRPLRSISNSTSTHPDMQLVRIDERTALVAAELADYYAELLPDYRLISIDGIKLPYPNDCSLNFTVIGDRCFITENQFNTVRSVTDIRYKIVKIKQGYSRCSICILNENAIITADYGIIRAAKNVAMRAYYLPDESILLDGYRNGFWGGCCGLISPETVFFNGNIESLPCKTRLFDILKSEKITPLYCKDISLYDNGGFITLY